MKNPNLLRLVVAAGFLAILGFFLQTEPIQAHCTPYHPHHCSIISTNPDYYRVFIKNNGNRTIRVAISYKPLPCNDCSYVGGHRPPAWNDRGWWTLSPGGQAYIADTQNRYVYFYAETVSGPRLVWSGDNCNNVVRGRRLCMFQTNMGGSFVDYTQGFR